MKKNSEPENVIFIRPLMTDIERRHPQNVTPSIFISYSSAMLESHGYETFAFDGELKKIDIEEIKSLCKKKRVKAIVFDIISTNLENSLRMSRKLKPFSERIIAFGAQPSAMPETIVFENSPFDLCIIGEPEKTVLEVIRSDKSKNIPGTAIFDGKLIVNKDRSLLDNLDSLPFPIHNLEKGYGKFYPVKNVSKIKFGFVMASRGCPFNCIYCSPTLRVSFGKNLRKRSAKNVVDEIRYLETNGVNSVLFIDDLFTADREWVISLCDEMIKRGIKIPWVVQTRIDLVDEEMLKRMKMAGCSTFCVGIESGNDRVLKVLKKDITLEKIIKSFKLIKNMGFLISAYFMIGNPTETSDEVFDTLRLAKKLNPDMIQVAFFTPYPGSDSFKGIDREMYQYSHYNEVVQNPSEINDDELKRLHLKFYREFYFRPKFMLDFISKRIVRMISDPLQEIGFIKSALLFLNKR